MPDTRLIVFLSPDTIDKSVFAHDQPVRWLYLGKQFHEKARLERDLGPSFQCLDTARAHNDAANRIRDEFTLWTGELNRLNGSSLEWWLGPVSSRNIYRSTLFQHCCFLEILDTVWKDPQTRPGFVVVESPALATVIRRWGKDRKIDVPVKGELKKYLYRARNYSMFLLRWANFIITASLRKCAATMTGQKPHPTAKGDPLVLIHTYIHPESLTENGAFSDRYFPYLYEFLEKRGRNVAVLPMYHGFRYNFFPLFSRVKKSSTCIIIPEYYLKISDILHAFVYPFYLLFGGYRFPPFRTNNCTEMIREDTIQDRFGDLLEAILVYRLLPRLKNAGIQPERCIDWYENQATSRALSAGFRQEFPGVPVIGAQFFLHYPNFLSLAPTVSEVEASIVPDRLLETSTYQCRLATRFAPDLACKPCAALRYAHLFRTDAARVTPRGNPEKKTILLLASFDMEETLELISRFQEIAGTLSRDISVRVKFHPDMKREEVVSRYDAGRWPDTLGVFKGPLPKALDDASLVISKNSGSIVEAAARGIPVIFLGNQTCLNLNPLVGITLPGITECYTTEELESSVKKYLAISSGEQEQYRKDGEYLRDLFFTDVNETTLAPFLE